MPRWKKNKFSKDTPKWKHICAGKCSKNLSVDGSIHFTSGRSLLCTCETAV